MNLSKSFTLNELTKSQEALRLGIDNTPNDEHILNLKILCENILQPIRDFYGMPVSISSGYRSAELCKVIGSSFTSQHTRGEAADFEVFGIDNKSLADFIVDKLEFDQCILEFWNEKDPNSGWVHCSFSTQNNRKQYLKADKVNGKIIYSTIR